MVSANDPCSLSGRRAAPRRGWSCGFSRKIADSIVKQRNRRSPAFSRHDMRPSYERTALGNQKRAQGMPGAGRNPWPPCIKKARGRNHRFSRIIRHSLRNGFNAYIALSLGTGLSCSHRPRSSRELGLSVGRPGPHDFASATAALVLRAVASIASRVQRS